MTADLKAATATEDIPHEEGSIARGTVAAQHHKWTAWVDGQPLIVFHAIYLTGGPGAMNRHGIRARRDTGL